MDRGTYVAASAGLANLKKLEIVNNNLANVNTPGFKRQFLVNRKGEFDDTLAQALNAADPYAKADAERTPGVVSVESVTDFTLGPIKPTGNPLDVALRNPNDFFVVDGPSGPEYTRAGNFTLNVDGELVTTDGFLVQGDGGALAVTGPGATITPGGNLRTRTEDVGRLRVVRFEDTSVLKPIGNTRFEIAAGGTAGPQVDPDIIPASLEMSNVSAITSMLDLITTSRGFDLYTRTARTIDDLNSTAISQIGRGR